MSGGELGKVKKDGEEEEKEKEEEEEEEEEDDDDSSETSNDDDDSSEGSDDEDDEPPAHGGTGTDGTGVSGSGAVGSSVVGPGGGGSGVVGPGVVGPGAVGPGVVGPGAVGPGGGGPGAVGPGAVGPGGGGPGAVGPGGGGPGAVGPGGVGPGAVGPGGGGPGAVGPGGGGPGAVGPGGGGPGAVGPGGGGHGGPPAVPPAVPPAAPPAPADPATRKTTLKRELVTQYLTNKAAEHNTIDQGIAAAAQAAGRQAPAPRNTAAPFKPGKGQEILGEYMRYSGLALDMTNALIGGGNSYMGFKEFAADDGSSNNSSGDSTTSSSSDGGTANESSGDVSTTKSEQDKLKEKHAPYKAINNYITLGTSLWGGINNGIGIHTNKKKLSSKNKRARLSGQIGISSNVFGMLANASKFTTAGLNLWGDQKETHTKRATDWMGVLGAGAGWVASGITLGGSIADKVYRKRITKNASTMSRNIDTDGSDEAATKTNLTQDKANNNWASYETNKKHMNSIKAQKYAMAHASKMNSVKANQSLKGIAGSIGGLFSFVGSLTNAIPAGAATPFGQFMKAAGGAIGALTNIAKQHEFVSDKAAQNDILAKREQIINEYITNKLPKLNTDLTPFLANHPEITNVTDKEKRRIIVGRLGVDLDVIDRELGPDDEAKAFAKINQKRALYIYNAEDAVKNNILDTLHLEHSASLQDIESVLRGD